MITPFAACVCCRIATNRLLYYGNRSVASSPLAKLWMPSPGAIRCAVRQDMWAVIWVLWLGLGGDRGCGRVRGVGEDAGMSDPEVTSGHGGMLNALAPVFRDARPSRRRCCRCGHDRTAHEHYRPGRDCALCGCGKFRRARSWNAARSSPGAPPWGWRPVTARRLGNCDGAALQPCPRSGVRRALAAPSGTKRVQ